MKKNQSLQKFEGDWFFFGRSLFPLEDDDVFDVAGLREEVDGLDGADGVVFAEGCEIAGEGGWIATDVENARNAHVHEGVEEFAVAAFSRRVDDGDVGAVSFLEPFWQPDLSFGGGEMCVGETVALRGLLGVGDGLADAVDAM